MINQITQIIQKTNELAAAFGTQLGIRGFKRGGAVGQIPVKKSTEDFDWEWQDKPSGEIPQFTVSASTLNVSDQATATIEGTNIHFGIPRGPTGPMGQPGTNGTNGTNGTDGADGANAEFVVLTLAEYLALPPETQMDGRWYVVPRT